ncbi:uncharacterized protein DSM5745_10079 [Aspergillus mulundensis]|uniref:Uncharacterized protein n=1 Tax=Aspergillus mulundensis TaxID=1810919 RepID=A0A3D8QMP5_9EURO|nr:Uncharacterized protein DSM5745_10079 [Aspergillus mulundensis]RDW62968.1 Uncharacterized protein DSM5745_10079 [Aspergillus mulundensis]
MSLRQDEPALEIASEPQPKSMHTNPVVIPPKRGHRPTATQTQSTRKDPRTPKRSRMTRQSSSSTLGDRPLPTAIASILEATAIPVPRRKRTARESQKLPRGDHVQDFSKLLMDGLDDHSLYGSGNSPLDILLSPPEEVDKSFVFSDCDSTFSYSAPSISAGSVPSLDTDVETPFSLSIPFTPSSPRSPSEKSRRRSPPKCESCATNHPLLDTDSDSEDGLTVTSRSSLLDSTPSKPLAVSRSFPRLGSLKSNLTASLRAIKSAAQSVSTFASPSVQPDDFLTRSLFTITPEMTDDRRPPPMDDTPPPALRRYLNPIMVSPAEMYSFQDQPHESPDPRHQISVQMQTYHRSGSRSSQRGRFQVSSSKNRGRQSLPFDPETPSMSRQREPRENSDFLRMVVLEMNMRRRGKLRDDIPTRAQVWLPPRKGSQAKPTAPYGYDFEEEDELEVEIPTRWIGISVESF